MGKQALVVMSMLSENEQPLSDLFTDQPAVCEWDKEFSQPNYDMAVK